MSQLSSNAASLATPMPRAQSLNRTISSVAKMISAPFSIVRNSQIFENKYVRRVVFEAAPRDPFVVSNCEKESFIVSTSDQVIGRYTYARRKPWDVDKLKNVVSLMPIDNTRTTIIDVGANIGTICITALKRGYFSKAIAIEPDPLNYSLLMSNIYLNGLQNDVRAQNVALGSADDQIVILDRSSSNFGDRRVVGTGTTASAVGNDMARVSSFTFDTIVGEVAPKSALIWMDVQGFEGFVLSGASAALKRKIPLCVEFWPFGMNNASCARAFKDAVLASGYREFIQLEGDLRRLR